MGMGSIATSGMQAAMSEMNIISNNIANVDTTGYKRSSASFADLYPTSSGSGPQMGMGVNLASVSQDFRAGGTVATGVKSNMSISGPGFFVLKDSATGQLSYSRNGKFNFDNKSGSFMMGSQRLQGFAAVNGSIPAGAPVTDLLINTGPMAAQATSKVVQSGINLNTNDVVPTVTPFDPATPGSYNLQSTATVYDSLGNSNLVNFYYVKTSTASTWNVYAAIGSTVLNASSPGVLTFDTSGNLASQTGLNALQFSPPAGAVTPQTVNADMTGIMQFAGNDNAGKFTNNGYPAGIFNDYSIDGNGIVSASYTGNTQKVVIGQVALANFSSPQGLQYIGDATWDATTDSGMPTIKPQNSENNINPSSLEGSNIDIASELVGLINAQNTFQANAQVEQTYNQVMQTVTKL